MIYVQMVGGVKGDKERSLPTKGRLEQCDGMDVDGGGSVCGAGCNSYALHRTREYKLGHLVT